ncbi:MAG: cell wall hydrolase [Gammaproteobacteria bacterium]|nr:cell wall hydrolase [Gammaproteobacteria bacterium]
MTAKSRLLQLLLFSGALMLTAPVSTNAYSVYDEQVWCLAQNIYYEARGEQESGQLAVATVTLNRVERKDYPATVCAVVWQPRQFSWTHVRLVHKPLESKSWNRSMQLAESALDGELYEPVRSATHFHAKHVQPYWSLGVEPVSEVGRHVFYEL